MWHLKPYKVNLLVLVVMPLLLFYGLVDSLAPRGVMYWEASYAIVYVGVVFCLILGLSQQHKLSNVPFLTCISILLILATGLASLLPDVKWPIKYIAGDLAGISMLFLFSILLPYFLNGFDQKLVFRMSLLFIFWSTLSFCVMYFDFNQRYLHGIRFDPPHIFAIAGLVSLVLSGRRVNNAMLLLLFLISLVLVLYSQWRAEILFFIVAIIPVLVHIGKRYFLVSTAITTLFALIIFVEFETILSSMNEIIMGTRFREISATGSDTSMMNRILEAQDVLLNLSSEGSLVRWIFGFGHGAMFQISASYPGPNVMDGGQVHNIHINFFLWLYRYGLFGATMYLMFVYRTLIFYSDLFKSQFSLSVTYVFFSVSAMMLVVKSIFYTPINDPISLFLIAGFLQITRQKYDNILHRSRKTLPQKFDEHTA
jgi:hypothetical protein